LGHGGFLPGAFSIVRQFAVLRPEASRLRMFGLKRNATAANLFNILACFQELEGVRLQVVAQDWFPWAQSRVLWRRKWFSYASWRTL
jgi:hypothetical protein